MADSTRFEQVSASAARATLLAYAVVALVVLAYALLAPTGSSAHLGPSGEGDIAAYQQVVAAMQRGVPYYEALHAELLSGGYGTASVFNWRTPLFLSAVALAPSPLMAQLVLAGLALAAVAVALGTVRGISMRAGLALLLVLSLMSVLAYNSIYLPEIATGVLILLSVSAYARGWVWVGFGAAVLALFSRELAGLYVLVCIGLAVRERRWAEVAAWAVALVAWAAYFAWHAQMVLSRLGPEDQAYPEGWVQFGGLGFVLASARFNGAFLLLPLWVTAVVVPLAVLGAAGWRKGLRLALTLVGYLLAFAVVGKPVNAYWGAVYAPLLSLGLVWAGPALRDLWRVGLRPRGGATRTP